MKRMKKTADLVAGLVTTFVLAGSAAAQQKPSQNDQQQPPSQQQAPQPSGDQQKDMPRGDQDQQGQGQMSQQPVEVMAERLSEVATVEKVDAKNRELMVKNKQGQTFKVTVPEAVTNLDSIKKGHKVALDYFSSVALSIEKTKAKSGETPQAEMATTVARVPGDLPGGLVANKVDATFEVVKVDKTNHKLTIKKPTGQIDTLDVSDSELQQSLASLKKGDKIHATYAEAIAVSIMPQKGKGTSGNAARRTPSTQRSKAQ